MVWTAIDRLLITWKSNFSDKIKFFPRSSHINSTLSMHHMDTDKEYREIAIWELHKNATSYIELLQEATSHRATAVWPSTSHL